MSSHEIARMGVHIKENDLSEKMVRREMPGRSVGVAFSLPPDIRQQLAIDTNSDPSCPKSDA